MSTDNKKELITFIMPVYNAARFLSYSIESVLKQSYTNWELIIIDDCSTDESPRIAKKYAERDERIRIINMEAPSGGAYLPRQTGIIAAKSKWVAPIDADDYVEPEYLNKLFKKKEETGASIVYPTMWSSCNNGASEKLTPKEEIFYEKWFYGKDCVKFTLDGWRINCGGGIIDKELYLESFNKFDPELPNTRADEMLTRVLLPITPKVAFSKAKYFYRINESSVTRSKSITNFDFVYNNIRLIELTSTFYGISSEEYKLANRQAFHGVFDSLRLLNKNKYTSSEKKKIYNLLSKSKKMVEAGVIKSQVSSRYRFLYRFNLKTIRFLLLVLDKIFP